MAMMNPESSRQKAVNRGFTLLIAVIFMSVMLSFGLALASLGYKQLVLSSGAVGSQYAFYAADAALECALYADQQQNRFALPESADPPPQSPTFTCEGADVPPFETTVVGDPQPTSWIIKYKVPLNSQKHCADITVYKYRAAVNGITTYIFSQGYDVACSALGSSPRSVARGINAHY